jgi:phosphate acetyltransferase
MNIIEKLRNQARQNLKPIVLPEGNELRIIQAASIISSEKIAEPILLGKPAEIKEKSNDLHLSMKDIQIIDPEASDYFYDFASQYYELRKHKGITPDQAQRMMMNPLFYGAMMLKNQLAEGAVAGSINTTGDVMRAAIQIVGLYPNIKVVSSSFLILLQNGKILTFADCAVVPEPDAEQLASIAISSAQIHQKLVGETARIAMLSFSTKGSAQHPLVDKVIKATKFVQDLAPDLQVDGELQFDAAYVPEVSNRKAPGSPIAGKANVFIFPDLNSANIGYKMVQRLAGAEAIGPIIQGLAKPYNDLSRGCSVDDIVNVVAICSILA